MLKEIKKIDFDECFHPINYVCDFLFDYVKKRHFLQPLLVLDDPGS